jgi:flagellar biosynthesis protein FlhG
VLVSVTLALISMPDQTTQLRRLIVRASGFAHAHDSGPRTLVVSGGKPGVGATTLAVNLAAVLAQDALRIVLVDADLYRADVAARCKLTSGLGIGDVLAGRKSIHEALQRGPSGMQILAGAASAETRSGIGERAIQRLLRQMRTLGPHADLLIIDAGNQPSEFTARLWSAADSLLLVTSPDAVAVMDSYALIKTLLSRHSLLRPVTLIVNQAADEAAAADVHRRIDQSCRRFLGLPIEFAGGLPRDSGFAQCECLAPLAATLARLAKQLFDFEQPARSQRRAA